jgi:hypothetical protein
MSKIPTSLSSFSGTHLHVLIDLLAPKLFDPSRDEICTLSLTLIIWLEASTKRHGQAGRVISLVTSPNIRKSLLNTECSPDHDWQDVALLPDYKYAVWKWFMDTPACNSCPIVAYIAVDGACVAWHGR